MAVRKIIIKSGKVSWQIDWYEPSGKRKRRNFRTKRDAEAEEAKIKALKAEGRYLDVKRDTRHDLGQLLTRYHKGFKDQKAYRTQKGYAIRAFAVAFGCRVHGGTFKGGPVLSNIGLYDLEKFRNDRLATPVKSGNRPRSKACVNRELSAVRHVFSKAVAWDMMEKSPFTGTKGFFYKETNGRLRFLSEDEAVRLLAECPDHLHPIVLTALHTGMRRGEILGLQWDQIRNGHIYLTHTKTGEGRQIPVSEALAGLFKGLRAKHGLRSPHVFLGPKGKPIEAVRKSFAGACRRAGIEGFRFHDLRHTFASWLVMKGVDLKTVQELLGHKTLTMTLRYAHLSQAHKQRAVDLIGGMTKSDHKGHNAAVSG